MLHVTADVNLMKENGIQIKHGILRNINISLRNEWNIVYAKNTIRAMLA